MPYRAQMGGIAGSGKRDTGDNSPDYATIIDAAVHGASSLIQQAYLRKRMQRDEAIAADERQYQRGRDTQEDARNLAGDKLNRDKFDLEKKTREAEMVKEGYHEDAHTVPTSSIAQAMTRTAVPSVPDAVTQPAEPHYDLERSVPYRTAVDRASVTGEMAAQRQRERLEAQQAGRTFMAQAAKDLAVLRERIKAKGGSATAKAMTGGQLEQAQQRAATGLLSQTNGSFDEAMNLLNSSVEGAALVKMGVQPRHLMYAHSQYANAATGQAIRMQASVGLEPDESAATVKQTREAVAGKPRLSTPQGAAPKAAAPAPAKGAAPAAAAAPAVTDESTMSDADLWEFKVKGGMDKAKATAYVQNRKKKK